MDVTAAAVGNGSGKYTRQPTGPINNRTKLSQALEHKFIEWAF